MPAARNEAAEGALGGVVSINVKGLGVEATTELDDTASVTEIGPCRDVWPGT